jgi:prepilin-type N-terminal cleavage/methylation domain-containing protein
MGQATIFVTFENQSFGPCTIEQAMAMESYKHKAGVTLVEILVVVAIVAILATMVISLAARIDSHGKERLTENTFALLNAALGEFQDYGYSYEAPYSEFDFPLDCNGFSKDKLENTLEDALGLGATDVSIIGDHNDPNYSGSEALYFFLSKVPESRKTLDKIDSSLITNEDADEQPMKITIGSGEDAKEYSLLRIIDPWGETLRYDYYDEQPPPLSDLEDMLESVRNFPVITSAGPDRVFGTDDDITNR